MVLKTSNSEAEALEIMPLGKQDVVLLAAMQEGLPLISRPWEQIAIQLGVSEKWVLQRLKILQQAGYIRRMGVVVRHKELGYRANGMVVWDIPDAQVECIAQQLAEAECVTLCYQRPRRLPDWPYNLFCMIHGISQESVLEHLSGMMESLELGAFKHEVLFSLQRFKQRGGRYINPENVRAGSL